MENYLIRASALEGVQSAIEDLGGNAEFILQRAGLEELVKDHQAWFSYYKFLLFLEDAARTTHCPHFGLHLSYYQGANILGPVGFVIQQAPDLRTALRELSTHLAQHNQGALVSLGVEEGIAQWRFSCRLEGHAPTVQQNDLVAGIGLNLMRMLSGSSWSPSAIYIPHAAPQNSKPYRERFDCPLIFDWEALVVCFDPAILDRQIDQANPELHRVLEQHLWHMQREYPDDYCGQIKYLINQTLTTGDCSVERVANYLAQNKRTLQRKLKTNGTTYQQLLDDVRFDIAKRYLRESNGSLTALSDMLCYANLSNFSAAFRQRHGVSPRDWKKQQPLRAS